MVDDKLTVKLQYDRGFKMGFLHGIMTGMQTGSDLDLPEEGDGVTG